MGAYMIVKYAFCGSGGGDGDCGGWRRPKLMPLAACRVAL